MPKTHLTQKYSRKGPAYDPVKALVLERMDALGVTSESMADVLGCSRSTAYRWVSRPSQDWPLGQLLHVCRALEIDQEDLRQAIRL